MTDPPSSPAFNPATYDPTTTYTLLGRSYEQAYANIPAQHRAIEWMISELLRPEPSSPSKQKPPRVLDVGSGTGVPVARSLSAAGIAVTGIDLTPRMVELARESVPEGEFFVADARTWEPKAESLPYDGVISWFAFLNGVSQRDIRKFFGRAANWVKEGGVFVWGSVAMELESERIRWLGREEVVSSLGTEEFLREIRGAGFEILGVEVEVFRNRGVEVGLVQEGEVWEEEQVFVRCRKKGKTHD